MLKDICISSPTRTHSASWWYATHLSESCRHTGTSWKIWQGTSMPGTGFTTRCMASTSWPSTGSKRTPRSRRSWGGSRHGGSLSPTCSTPLSPSSTSTGCPSGCSARPALSSESAFAFLHVLQTS